MDDQKTPASTEQPLTPEDQPRDETQGRGEQVTGSTAKSAQVPGNQPAEGDTEHGGEGTGARAGEYS